MHPRLNWYIFSGQKVSGGKINPPSPPDTPDLILQENGFKILTESGNNLAQE